jgi:tRNA A-37 threonylcarbamoyl transferase component Bud32
MPTAYREQLLGPDGLRLDAWLRAGLAHVVKQAPHRAVYHVTLPGLNLYVKHYPLTDKRSWLRQMVRPSKARSEYDRALAVAARGVPTYVPLAVGEQGLGGQPGDSFLITLSLEGTVPLHVYLRTTFATLSRTQQTHLRQRLAGELGSLLARMHDAGIRHDDLHAGNLLIQGDAAGPLTLHVIDLHAVHLGRPLRWRASRDNLVLLNRWFVLHAGRSDRQRFWKAYIQNRSTLTPGDPAERAKDLERRTWRSNLNFWRLRDRRCLGTNRYFRRFSSSAVVGHAVRDLDDGTLAGLVANPDGPFHWLGITVLKDSPSSTVIEFDLSVQGVPRRVVYKRLRVTDWSDPWVALVRRAPALHSWVMGHGLRERALPTARPLAVFHRRRHGLLYEGYLLAEKIPNAVDLARFVSRLDSLPPAERLVSQRLHIDRLARLVRELHRRHLSHRDLKAANVLVQTAQGEGRTAQADGAFPFLLSTPSLEGLWLIDLVGVRRMRRLSRRRRVQNLARLHASFHQQPTLTRTDKLRFLRVYLQWGLAGKAGWKRWWRAIARATQAKIERNRRKGRPLA